MVEMFDANNLSTTIPTATITNLIESINQSNNTNIDDPLLSSSDIISSENDADNLTPFTDFVANTTAVVADYATQLLTTTIATTAANLTSINNKTTSSVFSPIDDGFFNYTTSTLGTNTTANSYTNFTFLSTATNTNAPTDIINATSFSDLLGGNGINYYDDCDRNNPKFNCSPQDYVLFVLGPKALPFNQSLMITILYVSIFITGLLGNFLVCFVIIKHSALHTATNYYLFSLAVSDLIYLIFGLPMEVVVYWHQYPYLFGLPFCKARAYISEASTYVSVLTIGAFSAERYLAICKPLHFCAMSGFKRALRIIASLWVLSFLGAIPYCIWMKIIYLDYPPDNTSIPESAFCSLDTPEDVPVFEVSSAIFFFIPMVLIIFFYYHMGVEICSRTTQQLGVQRGSMHRESRLQHSRKAVIRMLAAVVLTFFICWLPFHIQRLWIVHAKEHKYYKEINEWLFSITGFAYYVTCTINPILYNVMSHRYRAAFKDTLCCKHENYNNGLARDQSSFRETTIASSLCNNSTYGRAHSVRRSVRIVNNVKVRNSMRQNNILWRKSEINTPIEKDILENHSRNLNGTNAVVVCVDNAVNGRTKVFIENEAKESLLNKKNNETCI